MYLSDETIGKAMANKMRGRFITTGFMRGCGGYFKPEQKLITLEIRVLLDKCILMANLPSANGQMCT